MIYVAALARPFTVAHIAEDGADLFPLDGLEPLTRCGLVMVAGDLWRPVELRPGDGICPLCASPARRPAPEPATLPLW